MGVIVFLVFAGASVALAFLVGFVWAVRTGQFDDMSSPPLRMLHDDSPSPIEPSGRGAPYVQSRS